MSSPLLDGTSLLLRQGLSGLTKRQELIANNLSNMDTPGYRAADVPFEQVLDKQIRQTGDIPMMMTADLHMNAGASQLARMETTRGAAMKEDGNGVDVDYEMSRLAETTIQYNTVTQLFAARMALLRSAVSDGRR